jgi:hypothetical protein
MKKQKESPPHPLEVGKPYIAGRRSYPEGIEFVWHSTHGRPELRFFWPSLTDDEVAAFAGGDIELGVYFELPVLLLLYRIEGATDWSDLAYTPHGSPQGLVALPDAADCEGLGLRLILTDADSGIVRVLRDLALSADFSRVLLRCLLQQAESAYDPLNFNQVLDEIYAHHPEPEEMLIKALVQEKVAIAH